MRKIIVSMIAALLCLSSAAAARADEIQIKGSDTLINLVQRLSEEYMRTKSDVYIAVTGGGSGTGISALINKKCDIANSSRGIKAGETANALKNGTDPQRVVVAFDSISVVVHQRNPVTQLTVDQLGAIFRADIKNWKEVGGQDMPITLYGRQSNSGTYGFFMDNVLKGDYSPRMNNMNGNSQIVEAVKNDTSGIGYVGVGYLKKAAGINALKVAAPGKEYVSPLEPGAVISGRYPIARPLMQYVHGKPKGAVYDFIAYELSPAGQRVVEELGFFPIPEEYREANQKLMGK